MATESSAVVRFINLAQQAQNPVRPTAPAPITSDFGTEVLREVRSKPSRAPLIVGAIALAGGAAAGGVYLGKSGGGGPDSPKKADAPTAAAAVTAPVAAEKADTAPAAQPEAPAPTAAPAPVVTTPVVSVPTDVLAATGFDIRVEPGATITLDGSLLGKAPLRVRNLQPGAHVLDIEAPAGFFSRRVELALGAGEAKELKVSLDPIEDAKPRAEADEPRAAPAAKRSRADLRRERKEKAREEKERKKEMRAARIAAAKAEKQAKAETGRARADKRDSKVVAEPLPEESPARAAKDDKMSKADADLEAAMAEITGKPAPRRSSAASAGASSLAASSDAASSASGKGTLMLGSKPPCDIIIDGKLTGLKTPQRAMELAAGTHRVTLVNAELGVEKKFKVKIAPGKTTKAIQDLTANLD